MLSEVSPVRVSQIQRGRDACSCEIESWVHGFGGLGLLFARHYT